MSERVRVVVVGAGAAGLATARELARAGKAPLVLERFEIGHVRGSSHGRSRIVRLAHDRADDVRDAVEAMVLWRRLERDVDAALLLRVGSLDFGAKLDATIAALTACGVSSEHLDAADVQRRFPAVAASGQSALFQADGAVALADLVLRALARDATDHGAQIRMNCQVKRIEPEAEHVTLRTTGGTIRARGVVLAAGPWIGPLAAQAGVPLPVRTTLQTPLHLALDAAPLGTVPTIMEADKDGREFYALPEPNGGVIKGGVHAPGPPIELEGSRDPDASLVAPFLDWVARRLVGAGAELSRSGCVYTWLPDDRFHLVRAGRVVTASCCSGRGFKFTPLIGARAAALANDGLEA